MKRKDLCRWCKKKLTKVYADNCCSERCYEKSHQARLRYTHNFNRKGKMAQQIITPEMVKKIAREYGRIKGAQELAIEIGCSRQRIHQIADKLRKQGVDIPLMKVKMLIINQAVDNAIIDLKKENPELFEKD